MSLEEKKQLLLEVRKKKMMLHSSILQSEREENNENSLKNSPGSKSSSSITSSPKRKVPNKLNASLNRLTKQNTDRNKEYRCELNVVVVRKNIPKPLSPTSKLHEKMKNGEGVIPALRSHSNKGKGSHIPVLKSRGGRQNQENDEPSCSKRVHWDENRLTQELPHPVTFRWEMLLMQIIV